ncbi:hypothetical protein CDAR_528541 [Caerostris darwini]|uniref:Uncharacterized protein n=1 Tax=Caerostris darwini TaxID=1538125 RepID=A0AAV4P6G2_9ARAC|nr:hypothetical protein CDAR_528541 [Caerostris darwini]
MECTVSLLAFRKPYSIKYENNLKQQQQNSIRLDLLLVSLASVTRVRIENHGVTFTKTSDSSLRKEPLITQHSFAELTQSMIGNHIFPLYDSSINRNCSKSPLFSVSLKRFKSEVATTKFINIA